MRSIRPRGPAIAAVLVLAVLWMGSPSASSAAEPKGGGADPVGVLRYDGPGSGPDYPTAIAVAGDGSRVVVAGAAYGGLTRGDDYTTIAYGPRGRRLWISSYNGPDSNIDQAQGVAVAPGGDRVFVTGYSFGGPSTTNDATTVAYDATTGEELWVARYDGPGHDTDVGVDVVVDPTGQRVFVTGASIGADGLLDVLTLAYDAASGQQAWATRFDGEGASDEGLALGVSPDGARVFVTGYQTTTSIDFLTVAYEADHGVEAWSQSIDAAGDELGRALAMGSDGSVYVAGYKSGVPGADQATLACLSGRADIGDDYITAAYDGATGSRRWIRNYDGPDQDCDEAYALALAPDGSAVFVTGSSFSLASDSDAATVAYDTVDGTELWTARYDGPDHLYDKGDTLVVSPDGQRVYVAGSSVGASTDYDFLTLFYDAQSGDVQRTERYDGPGHGFDAPNAAAVHPSGRFVYLTGGSTGPALDPDFATIVYRT